MKNWWVVLISLVLLFPVGMFGMLGTYILYMITGDVMISYIISSAVGGSMAALPIIIKTAISKKMGKGAKCAVIVGAILIFSVLAFVLSGGVAI